MDGYSSKKIGGPGSAFQQTSSSYSSKPSSAKPSSNTFDRGHLIEHISVSEKNTPSNISGRTTKAERTPTTLSSHKIHLSDSSESFLETHSSSRNSSSSRAKTSSSEIGDKEAELLLETEIPLSEEKSIPGESSIHRGLRIFLREEMDLIMKYRFALKEAQETCQKFIEQLGKEIEKSNIEEPSIRGFLLAQTREVLQLQQRMIQETEPFVQVDQKESLNKAFALPLPNKRSEIVKYLELLTNNAHDLNTWLKDSAEAVNALDEASNDETGKDLAGAARYIMTGLEKCFLAATALVEKGDPVLIASYNKSATYAHYAASCLIEAAAVPDREANNLRTVQERNPQASPSLPEKISEMMRIARGCLRRAASNYSRASSSILAAEEAVQQQEKNYKEIAAHFDNAFHRFQEAAESFAEGRELHAHFLEQEAFTISKTAKYQQLACTLEQSQYYARYSEKVPAFRDLAAHYQDASNFFFKAFTEQKLAEEIEGNTLASQHFQEAQNLFHQGLSTANAAFQEQQDLEGVFPPNILSELMAQ